MVAEAQRLLDVALQAVQEANREADEARQAEAAARAAGKRSAFFNSCFSSSQWPHNARMGERYFKIQNSKTM